MRGEVDPQSSMFHYFSVESRIPADHPLCRVKKLAESALSAISAELDGLYARTGRPSIPPERLLKAQLLIAFYSVRSDRLFLPTPKLQRDQIARDCPQSAASTALG